MLFDQVCELPVATLRRASRSAASGTLDLWAGDLRRWVAARWRWFRPRTVPVIVAFVGMLGVIQALNYLSSPPAAGARTLDAPASGALIYVDGQPHRDGRPIGELPTSHFRVRLVLPH